MVRKRKYILTTEYPARHSRNQNKINHEELEEHEEKEMMLALPLHDLHALHGRKSGTKHNLFMTKSIQNEVFKSLNFM